jgi:hypothetical protein
MFNGIQCWLQGLFGRRWDVQMSDGQRPENQTCMTCAAFSYCDPDDIDGCDGYCCHPDHSDPSKSPHHEYGGHWTAHDSWCQWWRAASADVLHERRTERALALRQAADAVDPQADSTGKPSTRATW